MISAILRLISTLAFIGAVFFIGYGCGTDNVRRHRMRKKKTDEKRADPANMETYTDMSAIQDVYIEKTEMVGRQDAIDALLDTTIFETEEDLREAVGHVWPGGENEYCRGVLAAIDVIRGMPTKATLVKCEPIDVAGMKVEWFCQTDDK